MKLLIGYDGSDGAKAALADLHNAGLRPEVEALVVSVADVWLGAEGKQPGAAAAEWLTKAIERAQAERRKAVEVARTDAEAAAGILRGEFPRWTVRTEAAGDSPAWAILKRANAWKPDLIVLGSYGRSALGRWILGSVSQKVLTEARVSVRIARQRTGARHAAPRLIVGIDGSEHAARALRAVRERTWPRGTSVRAVSAVDLSLATAVMSQDERLLEFGGGEDDGQGSGWVRRMAEAAAAELSAAGLAAEAVVQAGDPKRVLVAEAESFEADTIFLGAQGRNAVERVFLGSVSAAVAARAPCTVEVVRAKSSGA